VIDISSPTQLPPSRFRAARIAGIARRTLARPVDDLRILRRRLRTLAHSHEPGRYEQVYEDRDLTCRDCGEAFVFSSGEQQFFAAKGLANDPVRCPSCRTAAKRARTDGTREYHAALCASCGGQAMVPFAPRNDRPVYCSSCFDRVRAGEIEERQARA
jgi:CxxC-x17-CxxC domain-containing protein